MKKYHKSKEIIVRNSKFSSLKCSILKIYQVLPHRHALLVYIHFHLYSQLAEICIDFQLHPTMFWPAA